MSVQLGFSVDYEDEEHRSVVGHHSANWKDWDGGQIGGRPSWLQPRDIPQQCLECTNCHEPLCFVCQLYAPADEVNVNAFHRSLYVFACPSQACAKQPMGSIRVLRTQLPQKNHFFPEEIDNDDDDNDNETDTWAMHIPEAWEVNLCKVCGQRSKGKCPIQGYHFCGKHHQKEHKKYIFDKVQQQPPSSKQQQQQQQVDMEFLPSVCAESELVVEEEPGDSNDEENISKRAEKALFPTTTINDEKKSSDNIDDEEEDEDKNLEQDDLNEMTGAKTGESATVSKDPVTMAFYDRIKGKENVQEQCLRYLRWPDESNNNDSEDDGCNETANMPLWIQSNHRPDIIPSCPYCGAERKFEFQIMPQMLHYLLKDHKTHQNAANSEKNQNNVVKSKEVTEAIKTASSIIEQAPPSQIPPNFAQAKEDAVSVVRSKLMMGENGDQELSWGVVGIYTCTASCGGGGGEDDNNDNNLGAYREEFAWKQPSLD